MPQCCVFGCTNTSGETCDPIRKISHHQFPRELNLRRAWITKINRKDWTPTKNSVVCSHHFNDEDFEIDMYAKIMDTESRCRRLKKGAIPSLFLKGEKCSSQVHPPSSEASESCKRRRTCHYISQRTAADEEESLQELLNSARQPHDVISDTSDLLVSVIDSHISKIETCEKAVQARPGMVNVAVQSSNRQSTKSVSVQTNMCYDNTDFDFENASSSVSTQSSDDYYFPSESDSNIDETDDDVDCPSTAKVFLVCLESIEMLLIFCPSCGSPVEPQNSMFSLRRRNFVRFPHLHSWLSQFMGVTAIPKPRASKWFCRFPISCLFGSLWGNVYVT